MTRRLQDKIALVTGGASGIGKAIAERLAAEGATAVITDLQRDLGSSTANELGLTFLEQDVCDEQQWLQIITEVEKRFGRLDILVNNAGILGPTDMNPETATLESWRKIFTVNVEGVFLGCRTVIPAMRRAGGGAIVNLSSMGDQMALPHCMAYGASKAAVRHITTSVAQHCAEHKLNIRCNTVQPGMVLTEMWRTHAEKTAKTGGLTAEQILEQAGSSVPLGDFTRGEDIAAAVAFLVSEDARHVTGTSLLVDGGFIHCRAWE